MNNLDENIAVSVRNLGIFFPRTRPNLRTQICEKLVALKFLLKGKRENANNSSEDWVFRNVSLDIGKGEVFGVIGGNGSGKTTMLKIFSRVLFPSEGSVLIRGRVASLLAVGTGFLMEYSGRENIFLNGMIMGLSRPEVENKYQEIVDFSQIGKAIDKPVHTYSSGMRARLAFAVAAQLESDIVILDEVLSVGDAGFREKCLSVIRQMKRQGRTIIIVSHNMASIDSFCDRVMLIKNGGIAEIGEPKKVIQGYLNSFKSLNTEKNNLRERTDREGSGVLKIVDYRMETENGLIIHEPLAGDTVVVCLEYESNDVCELNNVDIGLNFFSEQGYKLSRFATENINGTFSKIPPIGSFKLKLDKFPFAKGSYLIGFRVLVEGEVADYIPNGFDVVAGNGDYYGTGVVENHSPVIVPHDWYVDSTPGKNPIVSNQDL